MSGLVSHLAEVSIGNRAHQLAMKVTLLSFLSQKE